ncbi:hypothetical protein MMC20_005127 [Loxospora ochrophaea]|nr:hypothetical protein [Loxospora ochrophaea]
MSSKFYFTSFALLALKAAAFPPAHPPAQVQARQAAATTAAFGCSNPSPEDGDGLCTCAVGTSTVGTWTPLSGNCPSTTPVGSGFVTVSGAPTTAAPTTAAASAIGDCPATTPASPIPGCYGQPGCAYVIASDLGPGAACSADYCDCDGTAAPLLPTTISGSATVACGYTTQPQSNQCPAATSVAPASPSGNVSTSGSYIPWAAYGDSWASGVIYNNWPGPNLAYDSDDPDEESRCLRIVDAYSVQLLQDSDLSWTNNRTPYLQFQACSGSRFGNIGDQINRVDATYPPKLATLTIGGNDAGFFDVVTSCVMQQDPDHEYGLDYPDPSGDCYKAIQNANTNINADWFKNDFVGAYQAIYNSPLVSNDPNFKVFVAGYAAFFNDQDPACNDYSFSPKPFTGHMPLLSTAVRNAIDNLVTDLNNLYSATVADDPKVVFVDINPSFDTHRFCETAANQWGQDIKSYFFNFDFLSNQAYGDPQNTTALCDPDFSTACPITNSAGVPYATVAAADSTFPSSAEPTGATQSSGGDGGSQTRVFHPKRPGHGLIEAAVKQAIKDNFHG